MYYFGGADPYNPYAGFCACGIDDTCAMAGTKCNCDANDDVLRYDDGYLDDTPILPIHTFKAGDTGQQYGFKFSLLELEVYHVH